MFKTLERKAKKEPVDESAQVVTGTLMGRYKSAADDVKKDKLSQWKPSLQRHLNENKEVKFLTIRVRVLNGDSEHDFHARFEPGELTGAVVCEAIAEKEGLNEDEAMLFTLWVVSKDLGLFYFIHACRFKILLFLTPCYFDHCCLNCNPLTTPNIK